MTTDGHDLRPCLDEYGHISVDVEIRWERRRDGASGRPAMVARFLRDLADDVERTGEVPRLHRQSRRETMGEGDDWP